MANRAAHRVVDYRRLQQCVASTQTRIVRELVRRRGFVSTGRDGSADETGLESLPQCTPILGRFFVRDTRHWKAVECLRTLKGFTIST